MGWKQEIYFLLLKVVIKYYYSKMPNKKSGTKYCQQI